MFVNFTNHSSSNWSDAQKETANSMAGQIVDKAFPNVPENWTAQQVQECARQQAKEIIDLNPQAVLCQGEMVLVWHVVNLLKQAGVPVYAATSQRNTVETVVDGKTVKNIVFSFCQFRKY